MFFNRSRQFNFDDQRDESNVMSVRIYSIWIIFKNGMVHMIVNLKSESKMKTTKIIQSRDKSSSTIFGGEHISAKSWPSSICFAFRWIWNPFCLSQDSSLVLGGPELVLRGFMFPGFEAPKQYLSPWAAKSPPQLWTEMNVLAGTRTHDHKVKSRPLIPLDQAGLWINCEWQLMLRLERRRPEPPGN